MIVSKYSLRRPVPQGWIISFMRDRLDSMKTPKKSLPNKNDADAYRKDGSVAVAKFEFDEEGREELREARALRQQNVSELIDRLLGRLDRAKA